MDITVPYGFFLRKEIKLKIVVKAEYNPTFPVHYTVSQMLDLLD